MRHFFNICSELFKLISDDEDKYGNFDLSFEVALGEKPRYILPRIISYYYKRRCKLTRLRIVGHVVLSLIKIVIRNITNLKSICHLQK